MRQKISKTAQRLRDIAPLRPRRLVLERRHRRRRPTQSVEVVLGFVMRRRQTRCAQLLGPQLIAKPQRPPAGANRRHGGAAREARIGVSVDVKEHKIVVHGRHADVGGQTPNIDVLGGLHCKHRPGVSEADVGPAAQSLKPRPMTSSGLAAKTSALVQAFAPPKQISRETGSTADMDMVTSLRSNVAKARRRIRRPADRVLKLYLRYFPLPAPPDQQGRELVRQFDTPPMEVAKPSQPLARSWSVRGDFQSAGFFDEISYHHEFYSTDRPQLNLNDAMGAGQHAA